MRLTIYSRPGCHLCDEMKAVVSRAIRTARADAAIEEIKLEVQDGGRPLPSFAEDEDERLR